MTRFELNFARGVWVVAVVAVMLVVKGVIG